jgi:AcrR family transcriptional regulator
MNNKGAKEKILEVVEQLLLDHKDLSKVTNREIASLANVNSALINYYYQSKENLVRLAADKCMSDIGATLFCQEDSSTPSDRIKNMLKKFYKLCFQNPSLAEIKISSELKHGSVYTSQMLLPIFREHFGEMKSDMALRLLTFQLLFPLQNFFLNKEQFTTYFGCDLDDCTIWDTIIDQLVDNIFGIKEE